MAESEAHQIVGWHYPEPYDFYDADRDADDLAELLVPDRRVDRYYSVLDERGDLVGFFTFQLVGRRRQLGWACAPTSPGKDLASASSWLGLPLGTSGSPRGSIA
jgi:hypothetical protein